jgi:hypothetical protein
MDNTIEMMLRLIQIGEFFDPKVEEVQAKKSVFRISWKKNATTLNTVNSFSIDFIFDMNSFLPLYNQMFPQSVTSQERVLFGIAMGFSDVKHLIFSNDQDNYRELAKILEPILHIKRGNITAKDYEV